jgi:cobalt-zinc-cadmium efflux system membrane fusion protein
MPTPSGPKDLTMLRKLIVLGVLLIAAAGGLWALSISGWTVARVQGAVSNLLASKKDGQDEREDGVAPRAAPARGGWDGSVTLDEAQRARIGLRTDVVRAQTEPTKLELTAATTDYDPNTLSVIRPPMDLRVDKVYKVVGDQVKAGEPLLDIYSAALAAAKTAMEKEYSEWQHDLRLLESRKELYERGSITKQTWADIVNDEAKSKLEYKLARDQLLIYGLNEKEIDRARDEDGTQKAKMTMRSPANGVVIKRDAVPGNLYKTDDQLLVIAPLERLWVHINVPEGDAYKVQLGQALRIVFPYNHLEFVGEVEHIYNQIDMVTRSVKFRSSVPNPDGSLRAGMYVRATLFLPPPPEQRRTVIPRSALVTADGANYVFVQEPDDPSKFHRKLVEVAEEYHDVVYITNSVEPGDVVAAEGSLILAQMYEELQAQQ